MALSNHGPNRGTLAAATVALLVVTRAVLVVALTSAVLLMTSSNSLAADASAPQVAHAHAAVKHQHGPTPQDPSPRCCSSESCMSVTADDHFDVLTAPVMRAVAPLHEPRDLASLAPACIATSPEAWRVPDPVSELGVLRV